MCQSQTLWSADLTKNTASKALKTASKEMGNNGLKLDERVQVKDQHLLMHFPKGTFSKTQGPGSINSYQGIAVFLFNLYTGIR